MAASPLVPEGRIALNSSSVCASSPMPKLSVVRGDCCGAHGDFNSSGLAGLCSTGGSSSSLLLSPSPAGDRLPLSSLPEIDESVIVIPKDDFRGMIDPTKLDACMRMVAASTQHLTGQKIVTLASASAMDSSALMTLRETMRSLIKARGEVLREGQEEPQRI